MYDPPGGMTSFVSIIQRASAEDAADLLSRAFENAALDAMLDDARLRAAAPALLAVCKLALAAAERGGRLETAELVIAITTAERGVVSA